MRVFVACCLLYISIGFSNGWRTFHRGRMFGGNLGAPQGGRSTKDVKTEWYTQNLDHFSPTDQRTWQQRYFSNDQYYNATVGGPVFIMIGGEGEASIQWMTNGAWISSAEEHGALLFQLEHRFYGQSHPTDDLSTENLKYLTSQQGLADLATFITAMNEKYELPENVKWIAFGGSYPGSLAAWLRFKYPHLIHGAMSASGPLLAQVDFKDYFRVVRESLSTSSPGCVDDIQEGIKQLDTLLKEELGQENLNQILKLCDPVQDSISTPEDISNLYESIADDFAGIVQYNKDKRIGAAQSITIDDICAVIVNETIGPQINRLGVVNKMILDSYGEDCLDYKYEKMITTMQNISWESGAAEGSRQWIYQTCTEFGFYQTSTDTPQIFGNQFPIDFFIKQCEDIYGALYTEGFVDGAIDRTNTLYGGLDVEVSNVVFVHGSIDPWHALGIIQTVDSEAPAIYIEGTAHCANMYPPSPDDLPALTAAREQISTLITSWLKD